MAHSEQQDGNCRIERLCQTVAPLRAQVVAHQIFSELSSVRAIADFMQHHVFAVWDSVSLLKSLQINLTCVHVPWVPTGLASNRRLINEIVLAEESDELESGTLSHFELYLRGMVEAGARTTAVDAFIDLIRDGEPVLSALEKAEVPEPSARFVASTWRFIDASPVHSQAAALAFGREEVIPEMFDKITHLGSVEGYRFAAFFEYLRRHIQVDREEHVPMAMRMIVSLCGDDDRKWLECGNAVEAALSARLDLWDGILAVIREQ